MNQKLKQVGLIGTITVLSLAMIAMTPGFIGEADAISREGIRHDNLSASEAAPNEHPRADSRNKIASEAEAMEEVPRSSSNNKRPAGVPDGEHFKAELRAQHLEDLKVDVSTSLQLVMINDPATRPGTDFVVTGDVTTFTAVYAVLNPDDIESGEYEILVTSDTESVKGGFGEDGNYDIKSSSITVEIDAVNPASINAKFIG